MNIRHIIITLVCFLQAGCISPQLFSDGELKARNQMQLAETMESTSNFEAAIEAYSIISNTYPGTRYYKPAVWRAAVLNVHPDNPEIDYAAAQEWLQLYLKLHLSPKEKEMAVLYAALIRQINQNSDEKNKLLTKIEQQEKDKATLTQKLKQSQTEAAKLRGNLKKLNVYKTELSVLRDKLKKMKDIDVQMHNTRKSNGNALIAD